MHEKRRWSPEFFRRAAVFSLFLTAAGCLVYLNIYWAQGERQRTLVASLQALAAAAEEYSPEPALTPAPSAGAVPPAPVPEPTPTPAPKPLPGYDVLLDKNPDFAGWLKIEGTRIDYPVMYRPGDIEYYLTRDFYGETTRYGSLFIDGRCSLDPISDNLIVYGHHTRDGSMFRDLMEYKDERFFREHRTIRLDTPYERGEYEIVAVILSRVYNRDDDVFKYYQFFGSQSEEEFLTYVENVKKLSLYDTGVNARYGDRLITLSTCEYSVDDGRLAVIARKIDGAGD